MASGASVYYGREPSWGIIGIFNQPGEPRKVQSFVKTFGFRGSKDDIMQLVIAKCRHPDFRNMWKGWRFVPVLVDEAVYIDRNGTMSATYVVKNEKLII